MTVFSSLSIHGIPLILSSTFTHCTYSNWNAIINNAKWPWDIWPNSRMNVLKLMAAVCIRWLFNYWGHWPMLFFCFEKSSAGNGFGRRRWCMFGAGMTMGRRGQCCRTAPTSDCFFTQFISKFDSVKGDPGRPLSPIHIPLAFSLPINLDFSWM